MISERRMKFDLFGQVVLLSGWLGAAWMNLGGKWSIYLTILMGLWQFVSACHLYLSYKYARKGRFITSFLIVTLSTPLWVYLVGIWAFVPVIGLLCWYFYSTFRDTRIVMRRPVSFWNLKF